MFIIYLSENIKAFYFVPAVKIEVNNLLNVESKLLIIFQIKNKKLF